MVKKILVIKDISQKLLANRIVGLKRLITQKKFCKKNVGPKILVKKFSCQKI